MSRHKFMRNKLTDDDYDDATEDIFDEEQVAEEIADRLVEGRVYMVKYPADGELYEAEIIKVNAAKGTVKVLWVEYEKTQEVPLINVKLGEKDRDALDDLQPEPEPEPLEEVEEKVKVDKALHARVIGRAGATIQEIQTATGCRVRVPGRADPSDLITLNGFPDQIAAARKRIDEIVAERQAEDLGRVRDQRSGQLKLDGKSQELFPSLATQAPKTIEIDIPKWLHSRVIGTKGSTLQAIREQAARAGLPADALAMTINVEQVRIDVPRQADPSTIITIVAPANKAHAASQIIQDKLKEWGVLDQLKGVYEPRYEEEPVKPASPAKPAAPKPQPQPKPEPAPQAQPQPQAPAKAKAQPKGAAPPAAKPAAPEAAKPKPEAAKPKPEAKPQPAKPAPAPAAPAPAAEEPPVAPDGHAVLPQRERRKR